MLELCQRFAREMEAAKQLLLFGGNLLQASLCVKAKDALLSKKKKKKLSSTLVTKKKRFYLCNNSKH